MCGARRDLPYQPHITLASHADYARLEEALAQAEALIQVESADVIRAITLLAVESDGRIERLESIALNSL